MKREILEKLANWKNSKNRKPLILNGARQVGKTYILKEFGAKYFDNVCYIDFSSNESYKNIFEKDFNIERIITEFNAITSTKIMRGKTLIILDEIQEAPRAITSLKYFCENENEYVVACAGSLLGVAIHKNTSFPVGKVNLMTMFPLTFIEFLEAMGKEGLAKLLQDGNYESINDLSEDYNALLKQYIIVGGMPEVVKEFVENKDFTEVRNIQKEILKMYDNDFSKHIINQNELLKTRQVFTTIPRELAKENKKFVLRDMEKGARLSKYEVAIQWLVDAGVVYKIHNVDKIGIPLSAYKKMENFKIYLVDVGLLGAMSNLDYAVIIEENRLFVEFKGALAEQYICQELMYRYQDELFFYSDSKSEMEVDFMIQSRNEPIPIEVKSGSVVQAKSLKQYIKKYKPSYAVRFSLLKNKYDETIKNYSLWSVPNQIL
ncbi:MAG: ATP-binding protein [Lachnospiraceae bacterium]|nr:ATP-binding protein [Lachnospiraceae bacterium]